MEQLLFEYASLERVETGAFPGALVFHLANYDGGVYKRGRVTCRRVFYSEFHIPPMDIDNFALPVFLPDVYLEELRDRRRRKAALAPYGWGEPPPCERYFRLHMGEGGAIVTALCGAVEVEPFRYCGALPTGGL